jgi:hypothetical protein
MTSSCTATAGVIRLKSSRRTSPTASLANVYAALAYYLNRREQVDAYVAWRDAEGERGRQEMEAIFPQKGLMKRLHERKAAMDAEARADENINRAVVRGLRRAEPLLDILTVQGRLASQASLIRQFSTGLILKDGYW